VKSEGTLPAEYVVQSHREHFGNLDSFLEGMADERCSSLGQASDGLHCCRIEVAEVHQHSHEE
jgi:hypothetical protein